MQTAESAFLHAECTRGNAVKPLPSGYETTVVRGTTHYTHGGAYFRPAGSRHVVVAAP